MNAKAIIGVVTLALALVNTTTAQALNMSGNVKPRHWAWAKQAQQRGVPLPSASVKVYPGDFDPMYDPAKRIMYIPDENRKQEHILFLHELGHVFDYHNLNQLERKKFKILINSRCAWWSPACKLWRYGYRESNLEPGEIFAEMYAACAIGLTREQIEDRDYVSYGYIPDPAIEPKICQAIKSY